ncbi:hypothetical protein HanXRQr2_Chr17g0826331 [Helianthus annuus]|uniref:Uncharacterized protein n=1 Tax=Helianthus annuus TaxID=4232 RepID=A0A9K3GWD2_HELAN|nr:hypothetical protein HanXRQr2_Chr17g0826331 [Helianthus annuus]
MFIFSEHQLLKDRKKNQKTTRVCGENGSINSSQGASNQNNSKGNSSPFKESQIEEKIWLLIQRIARGKDMKAQMTKITTIVPSGIAARDS